MLVVSPTENHKRVLQRAFIQSTEFNPIHILTMQELKERLFYSQKPLLKEEKRTLAFYNALKSEDKVFFNINNYFQAIQLAQDFFNLWEEFLEEKIDDDLNAGPVFGSEFYSWQIKTYEQLKKIKAQYRETIDKKGYTDRIFLYDHAYHLSGFQFYEAVVLVNQFYYTRLEKEMLDKLSQRGLEVRIYYQLPERLVDKNTLKVKEFTLKDLHCDPSVDIRIFETKNEFTMLIALLSKISNNASFQVVDADYNNPFRHFLSSNRFHHSSFSFVQTSIYQFFLTAHTLLKSLLWMPKTGHYLIPLDALLQALLNDTFCFYFIRAFSEEESVLRTKMLYAIYKLIDHDVKYTDFQLANIREEQIRQPFFAVLRFIQRLVEIQSVQDLVDLIDAESGIDCQKIFTAEEKSGSDLVDRFYQLLFDFRTTEQLGIVENWKGYFSSPSGTPLRLGLSQGILQLFLEYMRPKQINYHYRNPSSRMRFTTLFDTRNIDYPAIAVLNLSEGKIPTARQIPYLFTETQRKLMGLKTYDDIKLWEKYYFFRLVFTANRVLLFSQRNIDENIQPSSFVEEIKLYLGIGDEDIEQIDDRGYKFIYKQFMQNNVHHIEKPDSDFFQIKPDPDKDFKDRTLYLTPYSLKDLQKNPFVFYLRHIADINDLPKEIEFDFAPKLIGNIAHDIINRCWSCLSDSGRTIQYDFGGIEDELIQKAADDILNHHSSYYYKIPHNHTQLYFEKVVMPVIIRGIRGFFQFLHQKGLSNREITIYPESGIGQEQEKRFIKYISRAETDLNVDVSIRGRADLRIEDLDRDRRFIVDYKTGSYDKSQLLFYELYYYLIRRPDLVDSVSSYFYIILETESKAFNRLYRIDRKNKNDKNTILSDFKVELIDDLDWIARENFTLPQQKSYLDDFAEITRKDLFLAGNTNIAFL